MLGSPVLSTCSEPLSTVGHSWEGLAYVHNCLSPVQEPRADLVRNAYEPAARSCRKLHGERRTSCHTSEMINMETDKIIDDTNTSQQVRVTRQSRYPRRFPSFVKRKKKLSPSCASPRPTDRPTERIARPLTLPCTCFTSEIFEVKFELSERRARLSLISKEEREERFR